MSVAGPPSPCTLVFGLLRSPSLPPEEVLALLAERFGPVALHSPWEPFRASAYYAAEMGDGLLRAFASFAGLRVPEGLPEWKLAANDLEGRLAREGRRRVNLDPGLLDLTHVVLATGKASGHRVYLGRGVHAELEYLFEGGTFRPVPWTYPDYREPRAVEFFNEVRRRHKAAVRRLKPVTSDAPETAGLGEGAQR